MVTQMDRKLPAFFKTLKFITAAGFQVFTVMKIQVMAFWVMTL
jgi:hypothetical protein